jgi:phosphoribosylaminoimidazole (AIR) synthetase
MAIVVPAAEADEALSILKDAGEDAYIMGSIQKAPEKIRIQ